MIISKTPFRVSFFGGGTDYPVWFRENGGAVLATTIDKYCYITLRYLPPFFEHKSRIAYSIVDTVKSNDEIKHPAVRGSLQYLDIQDGVEIHHDADLPARSGMGSSSSFTVGLLHALQALKGKMASKSQLAADAIHVEQRLLKENVGCQDQIMAAYGGLCRVDFFQNCDYTVAPIILNRERQQEFENHLMLFFTGFSRIASEIAKEQINRTPGKKQQLGEMYRMVGRGIEVLTSAGDIADFGRLLHESWGLKRGLTSKISTPQIDDIYERARKAGATGGKLLGAGGGGFILFFVRPEDQPKVRLALKDILPVPFKLENSGSQIISYQPEVFQKGSLS